MGVFSADCPEGFDKRLALKFLLLQSDTATKNWNDGGRTADTKSLQKIEFWLFYVSLVNPTHFACKRSILPIGIVVPLTSVP